MKEEKTIKYEDINKKSEPPIVYVIQEIAGTKVGKPKINIVGATRYGKIKFLLEENSQIIFLVLLALGFLIVVDSSIAIRVL